MGLVIWVLWLLAIPSLLGAERSVGESPSPVPERGDQRVWLDTRPMGPKYEGIGALSAGASSRLLVDYPEATRAAILDLLFTPHFGASLNELKVEIGGDINSTCGSEPSHARSRNELVHPDRNDFERGYEWWLMDEARKRNPRIKFGCLEWGAPGWIGEGRFYSHDNIAYVLAFLSGARHFHGIEFDYIGIWNERKYDIEYVKALRVALNQGGFERVRIEAADLCCKAQWSIAPDVAHDPDLLAAIGAFGDHYPERVDQAPSAPYEGSAALKATGRPLWNSEGGPWKGDWDGFGYLAKMYNRDFIVGGMTKAVTWSLITSHYRDETMPFSGLMTARTPWSGHFELEPAVWAAAHVTQFVEPGWRYVESGCGFLQRGGSFVTLHNPETPAELSIIAETVDATAPQTVVFELPAECADLSLAVRRSEIGSTAFIEQPELKSAGRLLVLKLEEKSVYSVSTVHGQHKGDIPCPPERPFPFPFRPDFRDAALGGSPRYFSDQCGAFEIQEPARGGGRCLVQVVRRPGIEWEAGEGAVETLFGDPQWTNYSASAQIAFRESFSSASVLGRVNSSHRSHQAPDGYVLTVHSSGAWELLAADRILASGIFPSPSNRPLSIQLRMKSNRIEASVEGTTVAAVNDGTYAHGQAGVGTSYNRVEISRVAIE